MLRHFMQLDQLWLFLARPAALLALSPCGQPCQGSGARISSPHSAIGRRQRVCDDRLSRLAGSGDRGDRCRRWPPQPVSFERASTFFFPLLLLLGMAICGWAMERSPTWRKDDFWLGCFPSSCSAGRAPLGENIDWTRRATQAGRTGCAFLVGRYSLAEPIHQDAGLPFGGINPRTLAAWRQVEPGVAI